MTLLRVANLTIALTSEDPMLVVPPEGAMRQFLVEDGDPDLRLQARWGKLDAVSGGEPLFDSGGIWRLVAANGSLRFSFTSPALGPLPYKVANVDRGFTAGEVCLHRPYFPPGQAANPLEYPLDELLIIYLLRHGATNSLVTLRPAAAVAKLVACSFPPFHDSRGLDLTISVLDQVVKALPCYELGFTPDERVIALVRNS